MSDTSVVPAITVVLPVYNRDSSLRRALVSVRHQTLANFECIVVDDSSDNDVAEIVSSFRDRRFRLVRRETTGGPYAARFRGLQAMRGHYALFLDSDWELYPWALAQACRYLDETPGVDLVCALHVRDEDSRLFVRVHNAPRVVSPEQARREPHIPDRVVAVRRCVVEAWLEKRDDYFALEAHQVLTAALNHAQLYVDEPWTIYHVEGDDRVTKRGPTSQQLDDYARFLTEHWDLIVRGGQSELLDAILKDAYFALRRRRRVEAAKAAQALRRRGISPVSALIEVGLRKAKTRLLRLDRNRVTWV